MRGRLLNLLVIRECMGEGDRRGWCAVSAGYEVETGCVCCKAHWGQEPVTRFIGSFQAVG